MKKILALMLAVLMVFSVFAACGNENSTSSAGSASKSESGSSSAAAGGDSSAEESTTTTRDKTESLVLCFMNFIGPMDNQPQVIEAMNEITREKLNLEIDIQIMDSASYQQQMTLMLAGGEQVDLFNTITIGYSTAINNGYVLDLEENDLLQNYGKGIIDTMSADLIDACRFDGVLYGLPNQRDMAIGLQAYAIGSQYLDAIGYEYSDDNVIHVTEEELNDVLAQLNEKYPDLDVIVPQTASLGQSVSFDGIGGDSYGVLMDYAQDLKVTDLFATDDYYNFCKKWYDWNKQGYLSGDALTNDIAATTQVRSGTAMSYMTATKPGIRQQESNLCGQNMVILQSGEDFLKSSAPASMPWCISTNTVDEVAAMEYLNELYTNEDLSRLLCWGREGEEWVYSDDGHLTFPEGVDADTSGYLHSVNWQLPNQFIAGVFEGDELDLWEQMETFNDESLKSKALGFTFDNSSVSTEYTAIHNIYTEYQKQLEYGFTDPDVGIAEMVQRMGDAGLEKYITEKQTQLDAWAGANGVS